MTTRQIYEKPLGEADQIPAYEPISVIGMIDDVQWDSNRFDDPYSPPKETFLRGFTLVDAKPTLGMGLTILAYQHKPYEAASKAASLEMEKYKRGKFVKVTFEVFDTYEEASNGATVLSGCPCCPVVPNNGRYTRKQSQKFCSRKPTGGVC